jgi:hypothetical protein
MYATDSEIPWYRIVDQENEIVNGQGLANAVIQVPVTTARFSGWSGTHAHADDH